MCCVWRPSCCSIRSSFLFLVADGSHFVWTISSWLDIWVVSTLEELETSFCHFNIWFWTLHFTLEDFFPPNVWHSLAVCSYLERKAKKVAWKLYVYMVWGGKGLCCNSLGKSSYQWFSSFSLGLVEFSRKGSANVLAGGYNSSFHYSESWKEGEGWDVPNSRT